MGIKLKTTTTNINLTDKQKVIKGDDGGYYVPSVSAEGQLTWTPSNPEMPEVEAAAIVGPIGPKGEPGNDGIQGPPGKDGEPGPKGESGVYVGETAPTDGSVIWINPNGEEADDVATKSYVDEAIANAGGGGGSSEASIYHFPNYGPYTTEEKEKLEEIAAYYTENNKLPDEVYYIVGNIVTQAYMGKTNAKYFLELAFYDLQGYRCGYQATINRATGKYESYSQIYEPPSSGAETWQWSNDSSLYHSGYLTKHARIVGYWDYDTQKIAAYEISTSNNNYFYEEYGTYYYVCNPYNPNGDTALQQVKVYNDGSYFTLYDMYDNTLTSGNFNVIGFYYWG